MYNIKIKNSNEIINFTEGNLKKEENKADILKFKLLPNSSYFQKLERFITRIEAYEDDTKVFDGRVIDISDAMSGSGVFTYEILCESTLNFLNDTRVGKWVTKLLQ